MLEHPGSFHGLTMEYIINGQRSARRQVQITGQNVMSGKLYASLANMPGAARSTDVRHLSSEDLKKLVYESTQSVVALVVSDSDYVDTGDEVSVSNLLERELARQEVSSRQLRPRMWESVYWDPSWARPDKLTSYMNRALTKDATDNSSFVLSESARAQVVQVVIVDYSSEKKKILFQPVLTGDLLRRPRRERRRRRSVRLRQVLRDGAGIRFREPEGRQRAAAQGPV